MPINSRFILEGFGQDQAAVSASVGSQLTLTSASDSVAVKVVRGWKSDMRRVAVLLKPSRALKSGLEYTLTLTGALQHVPVVNAGRRGVSWRAGSGRDTQRPNWLQHPGVSEGEYALRDGGLSRLVKLHVEIEDESPVYLVATVRRIRGAVGIQTYFVPINGDEALLGHNACNGSFGFEDGGAYGARVELFDAAGNAGPSSEIQFLAPTPQ